MSATLWLTNFHVKELSLASCAACAGRWPIKSRSSRDCKHTLSYYCSLTEAFSAGAFRKSYKSGRISVSPVCKKLSDSLQSQRFCRFKTRDPFRLLCRNKKQVRLCLQPLLGVHLGPFLQPSSSLSFNRIPYIRVSTTSNISRVT
jgi:hypothetical protein